MQLRTEIDINAPIGEVWQVLTDFERYPEWNPFIHSIKGKLEVGAELRVVMQPPGKSEFTVVPRLLRVEAAHELRWKGVLWKAFFFSGEHFFRLQELDPGVTRLSHGEDFGGILMRMMPLTATARGFVFMNQALKRRCEGTPED